MEKQYQLKGHAKFVDIARLFGWDGLDAYWRSFMQDDANDISYATTGTDDLLLRLCRSVGKDIRPLFHFWGIHPQNPSDARGRHRRGEHPGLARDPRLAPALQDLVPADNAAFRTFA